VAPLAPGQIVVVATSAGEALATVFIGTDQVLERESDLSAAGEIVRCVSPADERIFGQRAASELGLADRARACCLAAGTAPLDAWLDGAGSRVNLVLSSVPPQGDVLARDLTALLGVEVQLCVKDAAGGEVPVSGAMGAGLPPGWAGWLIEPGGEGVVQDARADEPNLTAGEFIARLFPAADNWPPPRTRGRRDRDHEPAGND